MNPYRHEDKDSDWLTVAPHAIAPGVAFLKACSKGVEVYPKNIPAITAALYEAVGVKPPMVLGSLPGPDSLGEVAPFVTVEPSPAGSPQNLPGVMLNMDGRQVRLIRDEPLRVAAALVSAMREAEAAPDPAEVEELAAVLHSASHPNGCTRGPTSEQVDEARAALRWMDARRSERT